MDTHDVLRFSRISGADLSPDLKQFVLEISSEDGRTVNLEIPVAEFGRIVSLLTQVAARAILPGKQSQRLIPMPIQGMGIGPSTNPDESVLMIQIPGMELAFLAPTEQLANATTQLSHIAHTLTAKGTIH
jgi:hypothetical protein